MTRSTFVSLCAMALAATTASPAAAQQAAPIREAAATTVFRAAAEDEKPNPALLAQSRSQASRAPLLTRRRKGSMVGYVDDAIVESKFRIRFDAASGNTVPDRAEFFYAKCGCYRDLPTGHAAFDPVSPGPRPGAANDLKFQQLYLDGEFEVVPHVSVIGQLPLRWLQPQSFIPGTGGSFPNQSGLGDIRAGVKLGFFDTAVASATVKAQMYFPSGDASKGLGTDHASFEPSLLLWNELSPKAALESEVGVWIPVGGAAPVPTNADGHFAGRLFYYGIGPSYTVYEKNGLRIAPVVELVGWHVQDGNQTAAVSDASGVNIVNIKFGARFAFDTGSVYIGYGKALTDAAWYTDIVRFEYRYAFGK